MMIEARGLRKAFAEHIVLDGIDLGVDGGLIFASLGPNGAGKNDHSADSVHIDPGGTWIAARDAAGLWARARHSTGRSETMSADADRFRQRHAARDQPAPERTHLIPVLTRARRGRRSCCVCRKAGAGSCQGRFHPSGGPQAMTRS
jgi:hypothetical protein